MGISSQSIPPEIMKRIGDDMVAGYGGFPLIGTKEKIVDDLRMLAECGCDGILLTWPAFIDGMQRFQREVLPLLVEAGLR
jgi:FMNH2-dependent dimethyl sulfone monooxygenase